MAEITMRSILAETLQREEMLLRGYSRNSRMLEPLRGFEEQFDLHQHKCAMIREMMQSLEAEPVRAAIAQWQRDTMDGQPTGLFAPGGLD